MKSHLQEGKNFDRNQAEGRHFFCHIKAGTGKTVFKNYAVKSDIPVFYGAVVLLGTPQDQPDSKELRVAGYRVESVEYWVATDHHNLSSEEIARINLDYAAEKGRK